jgi:hypothetical protein
MLVAAAADVKMVVATTLVLEELGVGATEVTVVGLRQHKTEQLTAEAVAEAVKESQVVLITTAAQEVTAL